MPQETLLALFTLCVGTLFTPGPNNAMLATSGASFGFRRSLPHMLGVAIGFPAMLLIVGLALGALFQASALLREGLRWGGAALLLWMAWKIAVSGSAVGKAEKPHPMTFPQAAAFQWVNPKGWSMAVAATSQFILPADPWRTATITALAFLALGILSSATWTWAGQAIGRWLTNETRHRIFNVTMAALIVLSVAQLVWH